MTFPAPYTTHGLYGDVMGGVRAWLRTHPYLAGVAGRVFFRIPTDPTFPLIRLYRVGGGNQPGDAPIEDTSIGVDIWGGSYGDITTIAAAVKAAFHLMPSGTALGTSCIGLNADVTGDIDSPDPVGDGRPRKVLTVVLTTRSRTDAE